jgi:hypothetical protein
MSTAARPAARRRTAVRGAVLGIAVLTGTAWGASPAGAAPGVTIPLSPSDVAVVLVPVENTGPLDMAAGPAEDPADVSPVVVGWGGSLDLQLPAGLGGSAMSVSLGLAPDLETEPTRTLTTDPGAADPLTVSDAGGGRYSVALPPDDTVDGPVGLLSVDALTTGLSEGSQVLGPLTYVLEFTGAPGAAQAVAPAVLAFSTVPCSVAAETRCPAYPVTAGSPVTLTVPADSQLRDLGLGTLESVHVSLQALDADGAATGAPPVELLAGAPRAAEVLGNELTDGVALAVSSGPGSVTVTLPADLAAGPYALAVVEGAPALGGGASLTTLELDVRAVRAPGVTPVLDTGATAGGLPANPGLRSSTGVAGVASDRPAAGRPVLVAIGAGTLVLAALGGGALLRPRRRGASGG